MTWHILLALDHRRFEGLNQGERQRFPYWIMCITAWCQDRLVAVVALLFVHVSSHSAIYITDGHE